MIAIALEIRRKFASLFRKGNEGQCRLNDRRPSQIKRKALAHLIVLEVVIVIVPRA